jgi:hypothetical protein
MRCETDGSALVVMSDVITITLAPVDCFVLLFSAVQITVLAAGINNSLAAIGDALVAKCVAFKT